MDLCWQIMSLLFNILSRLIIAFLPRSKSLLISWLQLPSAVILEPPKIKSLTVSIASPSICHEVIGPDAMIFVFWMLSFKTTFSLSSFTFIGSRTFLLTALSGYSPSEPDTKHLILDSNVNWKMGMREKMCYSLTVLTSLYSNGQCLCVNTLN